ncbi:MAG: DUF4136 domain-containing protein [Bacteroidota bacterium]|nr:DUF4136 domain-containing protein [Bacteroidota bacterium]
MSKISSKTVFAILAFIIVSYAGCEIYTDVYSTVDIETDFTKYKTFAWLTDKTDSTNLPFNNEIIRNNIRNYFNESFINRGYVLNIDTPDILLKVLVLNTKKEKLVMYPSYFYPYPYPSPYPFPYYYGGYYNRGGYYFGFDNRYYHRYHPFYFYPPNYYTQKYNYVEGAIILNVFDRKKNKLIWSGTARGDIYDPKYIVESIEPAVAAIMKRYPIQKKSKHNNLRSAGTDNIYN